MSKFVLYCKSYRTDLLRVERLARSIQKHNKDDIPFHVSVPSSDLDLFKNHLQNFNAVITADEEIIKASPRLELQKIQQMPGNLSQQIVKSEFWRLNVAQSYLCLDSDAIFIRDFHISDFLAGDGFPYSVLDEAHELMDAALQNGKQRVIQSFLTEADTMQRLFQRTGKRYSFGPFPLVWHRDVWASLEQNYLHPKGMSFHDAIVTCPIESRWYGEALLAYQAIPLHPSQAFFKVYHYAWQFDKDTRKGITPEQLSSFYCGVIYQSSWERDMDWPEEGGNVLSRFGRRLRRRLGRI